MSRDKFIITGSEGFIGRALAAFLTRQGATIVCVDRQTGTEAAELDSVIEHEKKIDDGELRCVFHLAAQTSVFNDDTKQIVHDNITSFIKVSNACVKHGVKLIYASSSTAADGNTTSMYGISKRFNEEYARCYNPQACGVRFHNIYGPNPRQGTLLWHLMHYDVVTLFNSGDNIRHFTYIDDAVAGLWYVYENNETGVVNVANPTRSFVFDFAVKVSELNGVKLRFNKSKRKHDNITQELDERKKLLPLQYRTVQEGLDAIFGK